jgi:hypothetical protein
MATRELTGGLDHMTVVPENFEREKSSDDRDEPSE